MSIVEPNTYNRKGIFVNLISKIKDEKSIKCSEKKILKVLLQGPIKY